MLIRSTGAGCPVCGANHASCGPAGTGTPVDIPTRKDRTVSQVRKYHVTHNGHKTIMRLNDTDVKLYPDAELVEETTAEGDAEPVAQTAPKAATGKTRSAADKSRSAGGDKSST